jgi:hypothetical protein
MLVERIIFLTPGLGFWKALIMWSLVREECKGTISHSRADNLKNKQIESAQAPNMLQFTSS